MNSRIYITIRSARLAMHSDEGSDLCNGIADAIGKFRAIEAVKKSWNIYMYA